MSGVQDRAVNVHCWSCEGMFHIHRSSLEYAVGVLGLAADRGVPQKSLRSLARSLDHYAAPCPDCGEHNAWPILLLLHVTERTPPGG